MKKIFFLMIGISYSLSCMSQQLSVNEGASVTLPNGAEKINKTQALAHVGTKFNNDKTAMAIITRSGSQHMYKINDVLVTLYAQTKNVKEGHLLQQKKALDEMYKNDLSYKSYLKNGNNIATLIIKYSIENVEYYNFFCNNANNSRLMSGALQFAKTDTTEATAILNQLINSAKFKD